MPWRVTESSSFSIYFLWSYRIQQLLWKARISIYNKCSQNIYSHVLPCLHSLFTVYSQDFSPPGPSLLHRVIAGVSQKFLETIRVNSNLYTFCTIFSTNPTFGPPFSSPITHLLWSGIRGGGGVGPGMLRRDICGRGRWSQHRCVVGPG